jgi:hypothetical protein
MNLCDWERWAQFKPIVEQHIAGKLSVISAFAQFGYTGDPALQRQCAANYIAHRLPEMPEPLWKGVFLRLPGGAPMSAFAETRSYVFEGREIDLGASIDNTYVRELAQTGVLGLLALIALLIAVAVETSRGARRADADTRLLASGLVAAQVVVLVVGLTVGTISFSQMGTAFWLVAGAGIAISRVNRHAEPL